MHACIHSRHHFALSFGRIWRGKSCSTKELCHAIDCALKFCCRSSVQHNRSCRNELCIAQRYKRVQWITRGGNVALKLVGQSHASNTSGAYVDMHTKGSRLVKLIRIFYMSESAHHSRRSAGTTACGSRSRRRCPGKLFGEDIPPGPPTAAAASGAGGGGDGPGSVSALGGRGSCSGDHGCTLTPAALGKATQ